MYLSWLWSITPRRTISPLSSSSAADVMWISAISNLRDCCLIKHVGCELGASFRVGPIPQARHLVAPGRDQLVDRWRRRALEVLHDRDCTHRFARGGALDQGAGLFGG